MGDSEPSQHSVNPFDVTVEADGDRLFFVQLASGTRPNFGKVQIWRDTVHYKTLRLAGREAFNQSRFYYSVWCAAASIRYPTE